MEEILISGLFFSFNLKQTNKKKYKKQTKSASDKKRTLSPKTSLHRTNSEKFVPCIQDSSPLGMYGFSEGQML